MIHIHGSNISLMDPTAEQSIEERLKDAGPGLNVGLWLALVGVVDLAIVLSLTWALAPQAAIPVILFVILFPPIVMWFVLRLTWIPMARRYPAKPQAPDAVVNKSQSFVFGRFGGFNNCVHIAADEKYLHLIAPSIFRLLGAAVISLPWDSMREVKPSAWPGMTRARIDGTSIAGPNWCMKLAAAPESND